MIILRIVREGLGRVVIFFDWITRPRKAVRSADEQAQVAEKTRHLSLYQFYACPFCVKTRRALHRLNLPIELRDAQERGGRHRADLLEGGGRVKVPCLRIESAGGDEWIFKSDEIIAYLEERFA
jgi:glutaredoxin